MSDEVCVCVASLSMVYFTPHVQSVLVKGVFCIPPPTLSPSAAAPPPQSWAPPTTIYAPPPPIQVLGEDHCTQLFQMTRKASGKWRAIGMELGFKTDKLDALVGEPGCHGDESYYTAMLRKWLDWAPPNHPFPTLSALVAAIRKSGKERLAND